MAIGLKQPHSLLPVAGISLACAEAGIRYQDRLDLVLLSIAEGANTTAVFTRNKFCAAPVLVAQQHLHAHQPRALIINSGNANAGTGAIGLENAEACCARVAESIGVEKHQVLPFSTGVIGEQLPMGRMTAGITDLADKLAPDNWLPAAEAIMTTDTVAKGASEMMAMDCVFFPVR